VRAAWNLLAFTVVLASVPHAVLAAESVVFQPKDFVVVRKKSGPQNYYSVLGDGSNAFIRSEYKPPLKTVVLGVKLPDEIQKKARLLRWRWRARVLPKGGNECVKEKNDSAAVVYVIFKQGLHMYTLKYTWSAEGPKMTACDSQRSPVVSQDSIILESGGPLNEWVTEEVDLKADFRERFRNRDPKGHVPDIVGLGIMTDGDQTKSESSADFGDFELSL
jgi:hypothetical protein